MNKLIFLIALFLSMEIGSCERNSKDYEVVATGKLKEFTSGTFCQSFNYLLITKNEDLHLDISLEIARKTQQYKEETVTIYGVFIPNVENECPPLIDVKKITKK